MRNYKFSEKDFAFFNPIAPGFLALIKDLPEGAYNIRPHTPLETSALVHNLLPSSGQTLAPS